VCDFGAQAHCWLRRVCGIKTTSTATLSKIIYGALDRHFIYIGIVAHVGSLKKISHTLNALLRLHSNHASPSNSVPTHDLFYAISAAPLLFPRSSPSMSPHVACAPTRGSSLPPCPPPRRSKSQPLPPLCSDGGVREMSRLISELFSLLLLQVWCSIYR
jgi:hypothetical protein